MKNLVTMRGLYFEEYEPGATQPTVKVLQPLRGGIVSTTGARAFRRVRTTVNPLHPERASSMVTSGIFRFTRNPMYVGIALVLLGFFLAFGALSAILGLPAFVGYITRFQILPEERILEAKFGSAYAAYRARVRRWL